MHVLLTNDDGPPSDAASPYVHYLVDELNTLSGWDLSVVVPDTQRSWIGKAHIIGKNVTAKYIYPGAVGEPIEAPVSQPRADRKGEWTLLDGTPASCANIGIHHLYKDKGPVDLVISGPNYGRNSSAVYIMSSGTVGASMEAALSGKKTISVSYGFESRVHNPAHIAMASKIAAKLCKYLYENWDSRVQVYTVNIPLQDSLNENTRIVFTDILNNQWNSVFVPWDEYEARKQRGEYDTDKHPDLASDGGNRDERLVQFKWKPDFPTAEKTFAAAPPGTDAWALREGMISVTPLRAVFQGVDIKGEIKLGVSSGPNEPIDMSAVVNTEDAYVGDLWREALARRGIATTKSAQDVTGKMFEYADYNALDFDRLGAGDPNYLACSYVYRKSLIRKHYLSNTVAMYTAKNPQSALKRAYPESYTIEVDYAEFLDDALDEVYELRDAVNAGDRVWILKPSMSDRAQGIRVFTTIDGLQAIFDEFEEGNVSDDEDDTNDDADADDNRGVITSQLRHFIVQEYIADPLLLPSCENRKFHIRTYVLASGAISVYVWKQMLALFASSPYDKPTPASGDVVDDLASHLTNTCIQGELQDKGSVRSFWSLDYDGKDAVFANICDVVGELFKAAVSVDRMNFQPLPNAFELYGLDFLVRSDGSVTLLEVNAYPDFKQTGSELQDVVRGLFSATTDEVIVPFGGGLRSTHPDLVKVLSLDISGGW